MKHRGAVASLFLSDAFPLKRDDALQVTRTKWTVCRQIVHLARIGLPADQRPAANGLARTGHPVSYGLYLRLSVSRPSIGFFAVAAIPAARSFAIRSMSFTGTGLVRGNWTVPFRSS